jgi:putative MATE family efflux protein
MTDPIPFPEHGPEHADADGHSLTRDLLRLGLPLVAGMGGHALFNIVDLAMVGAYRGGPGRPTDQTLAAVGIASLVTTAPIVFANGIANGSVTVIARAFGAGKARRANQLARHGILVAILLAILLGVVPAFFSGSIASAFGAKNDDWERHLTIDFLTLMNFNAWSAFLLMQVTANMRAVHMSVVPMVLMLVSNVGNIVGNWLLVFGNLGCPEFGPIGSAYATLIARGVAAIVGLLLLARADPAIRVTLGGWHLRARFLLRVIRAGLPVALQWTVRMAAVTLVLFVIGPFGVDQRSAFGVGTRLDTLALFAGLGWGAACAAMVSHGIGRGRFGIVRRIARDSALLNVVMMSVAGTLYFVFADDLIRLFSLRGDLPVKQSMVDAGVTYLRFSVLSYPALALCVVWAHAMNGVGSVKTPLLLDFVGLLCFQVPLAWILSQTRLGVVGAWWALVISHSLLALAYWLVFRFGSWERKRRPR